MGMKGIQSPMKKTIMSKTLEVQRIQTTSNLKVRPSVAQKRANPCPKRARFLSSPLRIGNDLCHILQMKMMVSLNQRKMTLISRVEWLLNHHSIKLCPFRMESPCGSLDQTASNLCEKQLTEWSFINKDILHSFCNTY